METISLNLIIIHGKRARQLPQHNISKNYQTILGKRMSACYQKSKNYFQSHRPFDRLEVTCRIIQTESFKLAETLLLKDCWQIISFCMLLSNSNCSFMSVVIFSWKKLSQNMPQFNLTNAYFEGAFFLREAVWNGQSF